MSMALVNFVVKRIPYADYQQETHYIVGGKDIKDIEDKLKNDKNVIDFYRIS